MDGLPPLHNLRLALQYEPIGALTPNPRDSRRYGRAELRRIASAQRRLSVMTLVVTAERMILSGNVWLEAAKLAGYTDVLKLERALGVEHFAAQYLQTPTPPGGGIVKLECKKEACWEAFRNVALPLSPALGGELINREQAERVRSGHAIEEVQTEAELKKAEAVSAVPADTWFEIAAWTQDTQSLAPWERSLAFSLGKLAKAERTPSGKQADHGARILEEARSLGYRG